MRVRPGQVIFVRYGDHAVKDRKTIVLDLSGDQLLLCILPTSSQYDDLEGIHIAPDTRWGKNLKLDRDTWLYERNIVVITQKHFLEIAQGCGCHPALMRRIFATFGDRLLAISQPPDPDQG